MSKSMFHVLARDDSDDEGHKVKTAAVKKPTKKETRE